MTVRVMIGVMSVRVVSGLRVMTGVDPVVTTAVMSVRVALGLRVMTGGMTVRVVRVVRTTGEASAGTIVRATTGRMGIGGRRCRGGGGSRTGGGMIVGRSGSR
jgi:hypothetical protein